MTYKPTAVTECDEERGVIPADALFAVHDTQYLEIKKWKDE